MTNISINSGIAGYIYWRIVLLVIVIMCVIICIKQLCCKRNRPLLLFNDQYENETWTEYFYNPDSRFNEFTKHKKE